MDLESPHWRFLSRGLAGAAHLAPETASQLAHLVRQMRPVTGRPPARPPDASGSPFPAWDWIGLICAPPIGRNAALWPDWDDRSFAPASVGFGRR